MEFTAIKELNLVSRYPKIFTFKNNTYFLGSEVLNAQQNIKQYWVFIYEMNNDLEIIIETKKLFFKSNLSENIMNSLWIRDIVVHDDHVIFNIEIKENILNEKFEHQNFMVKTANFDEFEILKKYESKDFLFRDFIFNRKNIVITSKIEECDNFIWGKYLFNFIVDNEIIEPKFDNIVNYNEDRGHVFHSSVNNSILFSIRHYVHETDYYIYKNYTAKTNDYVNFYETKEILFKNDLFKCDFYSYPHLFEYKNRYFAISNQDEFGKNKKVVLFSVEL